MKISFDIYDINHQLFAITVVILRGIAYLTGFSYEMINIIVWFMLIPVVILYLIHKYLGHLAVLVCGYLLWNFRGKYDIVSNDLFKWSVDLLLKIGKQINKDYLTTSSIVCLYVPYLLILLLIILKNKKNTKRILKYNIISIGILIALGYVLAISFNKYIPNKRYMKGMQIEVKK